MAKKLTLTTTKTGLKVLVPAKRTAPHWVITVHMGTKVEGRCSDGRTFSEPVKKTWAFAKGFQTAMNMNGATSEILAAEEK